MENSADTLEEIVVLEEALSYVGPDRVAPYLEYHKERESKKFNIQRRRTGLYELDLLMNGFQTGEVTVISGPTGSGKTLLADSISQRFMRLEKINVAWFSFEVPTEQMIKKYVQAEDSQSLGLYVPMELKTGNLNWLTKKCLEAKLKYNCEAIFIDHLHFLVDMNIKQNMSLNIGAAMRHIKHDIAVAMNLMVFIIAHQGQPKDEEPSIENIRDSSFIGQEADNVFIVYRAANPIPSVLENNAKIKGYQLDYSQGLATVKIEKARREGIFRKKLSYVKNGYWLEEVNASNVL